MPTRELISALVDLVLPRDCVGCGRAGAGLCAACRPSGPLLHSVVAGLPVVAATEYGGATRAALLAYKERGRRDLARPLAGLLAASAVAFAAPAKIVLVPVPSAARVARERGGDHVLRLARRAARRTGHGVAADALALGRAVHDSAGLGAAARASNLHGAMRARQPQGAAGALVVDDIATSGATLREAVRALRAAGWEVCGAAVIAATPRRAQAAAGPSDGAVGRDTVGGT